MNARQQWLRNYIKDCISRIKEAETNQLWNEYLKQIKSLSDEISWAANEWEKCYAQAETDHMK